MPVSRLRFPLAAAVLAVLLTPMVTHAQERSGNFLDNLFNRNEQQQQQPGQVAQGGQAVAEDANDPGTRLGRIENALRQLTGKVEQLQYRNQQLEMQLKRLQDDTDYRLQQLGSKGGPARATTPNVQGAPAAPSGRRSDVFDPAQDPNAPGAPRTLGNAAIAASEPDQPVGAPNGRAAGAPLDLSTLAADPPQVPAAAAPAAPNSNAEPVTAKPMTAAPIQPPIQNAAPATRLATLPPSAKPQDEYDLAYGYVLHKDYALAEQAFRDFLKKYPNERLVPDAQYWLGESLYQRQRYRDAAESFLAVSTKYERSGKAPNALLRLGQSLAALKQKEAACATLTEVGRKYPKASASVKRGVAQEIKRVHC
jgi:tol-pal system protein YbgF